MFGRRIGIPIGFFVGWTGMAMMLATASMRCRGGGICGGKIRWMTAADVQPTCDIAQQHRRE
ncbi:hypothetical protein [Rosistilla ulvae]|uniref:hypothetical protein n=1 Tax=Rosistilla ulvae TaxID=1930277 RepID=UPI00119D7CA4|nr:hypothetical protein [Rosistilla ulvae]